MLSVLPVFLNQRGKVTQNLSSSKFFAFTYDGVQMSALWGWPKGWSVATKNQFLRRALLEVEIFLGAYTLNEIRRPPVKMMVDVILMPYLEHQYRIPLSNKEWKKRYPEDFEVLGKDLVPRYSLSDIYDIIPPNTRYRKEIIQKTLASPNFGVPIDVNILNFTLKKPIKVTRLNWESVLTWIKVIYYHHTYQHFKQYIGKKKFHQFRIKYTSESESPSKRGRYMVIKSGFSLAREVINSADLLQKVMKETVDDSLVRDKKFMEYLTHSKTKEIDLTGFSFETVVKFYGRPKTS